MSWLTFIASLVHSLAWPVSMALVVTVLRQPIAAALNQGIRRLRAGPVEVEFGQELAEVRQELRRSPELAEATVPVLAGTLREELARLAEVAPRAAVLEAYARIEAGLVDVLDGAGAPSYSAIGGRALALLARRHKLISDETLTAMEGLAMLRDLTAHDADTITMEHARDYLAMADAVLYALRAKPAE